MKKILILCSFFLFANFMNAQTEKDSVIQVIKTMFDGMRSGDSTAISGVFADNIQMFTIFKTKKGEHKMGKGDAQKFLNAVGTLHDQVWDEKIWSIGTNRHYSCGNFSRNPSSGGRGKARRNAGYWNENKTSFIPIIIT
mgnify:CR=1 FL=1